MTVLSFLINAGLLIYALINFRKKGIIIYGILFYFITYSIISNVFFNLGLLLGERLIYLSSLGFCIVIGALLKKALRIDSNGKLNNNLKTILPFILIIPIFSYATINRNKVWKNNYTLYKNDINNAPNSAKAHLFYGIELIGKYNKSGKKDELSEAIKEIKKAIRINPDFYHAYYNLGVAYEKAEDYDMAISCYESVLKIQPHHTKSHLNLGLIYGRTKGQLDKSIYYLEKLMNSNYKEESLFDNLGIAYAMKGDFDNALKTFLTGVKYNPDNAKLYMNIGITYDNMGNKESAKKYYQKAFELDPSLKRN